ELQHLLFRGEPSVRAGAGEVVQRAARLIFCGAHIERPQAVAVMLEEIDAKRIKREIERYLEIPGEMRARDLQAVRLEIVDKALAEAELLAQCHYGIDRPTDALGVPHGA